MMRTAAPYRDHQAAAPLARRSLLALTFAWLLVAAGALALWPAGAQPPAYTPRDETPEQFPDHPGRDDTFYACTPCHGFMLVAQQGMARWQWDETVELMIDKHGMPVPETKDRDIMLGYLEKAFPPRAPKGPPGWKPPFPTQ